MDIVIIHQYVLERLMDLLTQKHVAQTYARLVVLCTSKLVRGMT